MDWGVSLQKFPHCGNDGENGLKFKHFQSYQIKFQNLSKRRVHCHIAEKWVFLTNFHRSVATLAAAMMKT